MLCRSLGRLRCRQLHGVRRQQSRRDSRAGRLLMRQRQPGAGLVPFPHQRLFCLHAYILSSGKSLSSSPHLRGALVAIVAVEARGAGGRRWKSSRSSYSSSCCYCCCCYCSIADGSPGRPNGQNRWLPRLTQRPEQMAPQVDPTARTDGSLGRPNGQNRWLPRLTQRPEQMAPQVDSTAKTDCSPGRQEQNRWLPR